MYDEIRDKAKKVFKNLSDVEKQFLEKDFPSPKTTEFAPSWYKPGMDIEEDFMVGTMPKISFDNQKALDKIKALQSSLLILEYILENKESCTKHVLNGSIKDVTEKLLDLECSLNLPSDEELLKLATAPPQEWLDED